MLYDPPLETGAKDHTNMAFRAGEFS
jgi:hypothetical protein